MRRAAEFRRWQSAYLDDGSYPVFGGFWRPVDPHATSDFDDVFRYVARRSDWDWRLISAIARTESGYDPRAVSRRGAMGLMQVMPDVAARLGAADIFDPVENVRLGVAHLDEIASVLRFPPHTPPKDRLSIILASYNSGPGHVLDARRLAVEAGENYNSWPTVAKFLRLKADPEHFENDLARAGEFSGASETIGFVTRAMGFYDANRVTHPEP